MYFTRTRPRGRPKGQKAPFMGEVPKKAHKSSKDNQINKKSQSKTVPWVSRLGLLADCLNGDNQTWVESYQKVLLILQDALGGPQLAQWHYTQGQRSGYKDMLYESALESRRYQWAWRIRDQLYNSTRSSARKVTFQRLETIIIMESRLDTISSQDYRFFLNNSAALIESLKKIDKF